jgi:hypothetical protein
MTAADAKVRHPPSFKMLRASDTIALFLIRV